jgi:septal ring factor EnvC (AmiA/AmiB activator)
MSWGPKAGITFGMICAVLFFEGTEINSALAAKDDLAKGKKKIQTINKALTKERKKLSNAKKRERKVLTELDQIERQVSERKKRLGKIQADLKNVEGKIKIIPSRIHNLEKLVGHQEKRLKERLVARYKMGAGGYLKLLFTSTSHTSFENRMRSMNAILEHDVRLIKDYENNLSLLRKAKESLTWQENELIQGRKRIQNQRMELARKKRQKKQFLNYIKAKKELYIKAIREYEEASKELQELLKELEKKEKVSNSKPRRIKVGRRAFKYWKGNLPFPVEGRISKGFGKKINPVLHTYVFYKGIEIEAPIGSKVRSIHWGKVIFSSWLKGYGNVIIIDHGDIYYTLFAHLSKSLKDVGERVDSGEIIGLVGDYDSFEGAHLYFEIRHNGKPINPLNWLAKKGNRISHRRKK